MVPQERRSGFIATSLSFLDPDAAADGLRMAGDATDLLLGNRPGLLLIGPDRQTRPVVRLVLERLSSWPFIPVSFPADVTQNAFRDAVEQAHTTRSDPRASLLLVIEDADLLSSAMLNELDEAAGAAAEFGGMKFLLAGEQDLGPTLRRDGRTALSHCLRTRLSVRNPTLPADWRDAADRPAPPLRRIETAAARPRRRPRLVSGGTVLVVLVAVAGIGVAGYLTGRPPALPAHPGILATLRGAVVGLRQGPPAASANLAVPPSLLIQPRRAPPSQPAQVAASPPGLAAQPPRREPDERLARSSPLPPLSAPPAQTRPAVPPSSAGGTNPSPDGRMQIAGPAPAPPAVRPGHQEGPKPIVLPPPASQARPTPGPPPAALADALPTPVLTARPGLPIQLSLQPAGAPASVSPSGLQTRPIETPPKPETARSTILPPPTPVPTARPGLPIQPSLQPVGSPASVPPSGLQTRPIEIPPKTETARSTILPPPDGANRLPLQPPAQPAGSRTPSTLPPATAVHPTSRLAESAVVPSPSGLTDAPTPARSSPNLPTRAAGTPLAPRTAQSAQSATPVPSPALLAQPVQGPPNTAEDGPVQPPHRTQTQPAQTAAPGSPPGASALASAADPVTTRPRPTVAPAVAPSSLPLQPGHGLPTQQPTQPTVRLLPLGTPTQLAELAVPPPSAPQPIASLPAPASPGNPVPTAGSARSASPGSGRGASLLLLAGPDDTLQSLYREVYRGVAPPPYGTVAALNPSVLRPGMRLIFPAPPHGWPRLSRPAR